MSPILRPPTIAAALSATINLLCMRRLTRPKSKMKSKMDQLPIGERVEQTDLDIGVGIEGGFDGIAGLVVGIVDEQPHPDPAIGRLHHAVDDDPAGNIAVPGVVLHVETSLGQVGQRQTDDEGLAPVAQEAEAGEARMLVGRRTEEWPSLVDAVSSNAVDTVRGSSGRGRGR